jgi:HTH-type transcriptional regulator, sugar sensing transcriptional regulator
MNKYILKQIGFSDNETKIYLAVLELGESSASEICRSVKMNRTQTYDVLEALMSKGLLSYIIKNNRKQFQAASPEKLLDYLKEKKKNITEQENQIRTILPQLLSIKKSKQSSTKTGIYSGKEGIKTIYDDILRNAKQYLVLGGTGKISEILLYYFPHHETDRIKNKISLKILFNKELKGKEITGHRKYAEIKFLPAMHTIPMPAIIYNNRVVMVLWTEPLAIVIDSKEVADTYKEYFKLLWGISKI